MARAFTGAFTATHRSTGKPDMAHVLIYGMNYAPEVVGVGRYTTEIASELARRGYQVSVVTTPPHYPYWDTRVWRSVGIRNRHARARCGGVDIWRCPLILRHPMRGIWRLLAPLSFAVTSTPVVIWRMLRDRPRLVICVEPTLLAAPAALLGARLVGAQLALHVHDLEPETALATGAGTLSSHMGAGFREGRRANSTPNTPGQRDKPTIWSSKSGFCPAGGWAQTCGRFAAARLARLRRHFDCAITLSPAMGQALERTGVARDRVRLWPNWIDVPRIARGHDPVLAAAWRAETGARSDQLIVLCAGSINRKHAPLLLTEAARRLRHRDDLVFVMAGDGPLRADLMAATADLPNVRLLPLQPEERLPALLQFADVHVMPLDPTWDELALPSRLGGMLASGKPVVVTCDDGTELAQFLEGAAILCPPHNAKALAEAIVQAVVPRAAPQASRQRRARWRKALLLDRRRCLNGVVEALVNLMTMPARQPGAVQGARDMGGATQTGHCRRPGMNSAAWMQKSAKARWRN